MEIVKESEKVSIGPTIVLIISIISVTLIALALIGSENGGKK